MNAAISFAIMDQLRRSLVKLGKAVNMQNDSERIASELTISRFQLAFGLSWKAMKRLAEMDRTEPLPSSPKAVLREAYQRDWFESHKLWEAMVDDRNLITHVYDEDEADMVYERIKTYYPEMQRVYEKLLTVAKQKD